MRSTIVLFFLTIYLFGCPCDTVGPAYFVVGEFGDVVHGDSYVIRLDDPTDIAHARELIRDPEGVAARILVCSIAPGPGDLPNQDFLNGGEPWSWHVTEFQGFAEFTIEILDGWPSFVEEDIEGWIANTNGTIGFWNYTVIMEVSLEEISTTP
ncbi:MAG: hypothetical protein AAB353_04355 [Candidatus Hydrogenedentota bacterium]